MTMNVANALRASPIWAQLQEHNQSETKWKTHALVVGGYLLIAIGIALVAASFYMSTIIHPLLALATPVAPFAAGAYLLSHAKDSHLVLSIFRGSDPIFKGITNKGGNDCWINATIQMLLHSPAFANRIRAAKGAFRLFSHPLQPLFDAFNAYEKGEPIDSQKLRKWLDESGVTSSSDQSEQDDPIRFLQFFMQKIDYQLPVLYEKTVDILNGQIVSQSESRTSSKNPVRYFDIMSYFDLKKPSIEECLRRYFSSSEILPSGTERSTIHFMKRAPEDFGVSIPQADDSGFGNGVRGFSGGNKTEVVVDAPLNLQLNVSQVGEEATYTCDSFFYHSGRGAASGHWMAVIKKEGKWWHASDSHISEISETDALKKMKTASFIHYTKV